MAQAHTVLTPHLLLSPASPTVSNTETMTHSVSTPTEWPFYPPLTLGCADVFPHGNPLVSARFDQPGCSTGTLGCKRPFTSQHWAAWDGLTDQSPIRKSTLLKDASSQSPSIPSVLSDPNKLVCVWLHQTNTEKSERQKLWKKFFKSPSTFSILWLEVLKHLIAN